MNLLDCPLFISHRLSTFITNQLFSYFFSVVTVMKIYGEEKMTQKEGQLLKLLMEINRKQSNLGK